jgi:diguanylate cyclase (GGDEF)-like protein
VFLLFAHAQDSSLTTKQTIRYCADPDWMPFEGIIDGKHKGIADEYAMLFRQLIAYELQLVPTSTWKETMSFLSAGRCELTLLLNRSEERDKQLLFTRPYFFGPNVLVTNNNQAFIQDLSAVGDLTLGVVEGFRLVEEVKRYYPQIEMTLVESEVEGLQQLASGNIDVYVGSLLTVNARLRELGLTSLRINGWVSIQDELRVGVIRSRPELVSVFNEAIDKISTRQHNDIFNRWSNAQVVKQVDYRLLLLLICGSFMMVAAIFWRYKEVLRIKAILQRKNTQLELTQSELIKANEDLEYLSFHDNLTALYNRRYFMTALKHHFDDAFRQNKSVSLMMIDIDHFKAINDHYGHSVGDEALKELGQILLKSIRGGDVAARWGGEEFAIFMPSTNQRDAMQLATRIQQVLEETSFKVIDKLTVSIGVSEYDGEDTIKSWLERTDKALYKAKNKGRNCVQFGRVN